MNVTDREFQITLPSNASMELYPENEATNYTTKLCYPLNLEGNWEVALVDLQYPIEMANVPSNTIMGFMIVLPDKYTMRLQNKLEDATSMEKQLAEENSESVNPAEYTSFIANMKEFVYKREQDQPASETTGGIIRTSDLYYTSCSYFKKFYFRTPAEICEEIVHLFNSLFSHVTDSNEVKPAMSFSYNASERKCNFFYS